MDSDSMIEVRKSLHHVFESQPKDLLSALVSLGWDEIVRADPAAATSALFEEQGRHRAASAALDHVLLARLGTPLSATVIWPHPRGGERPSSELNDDTSVAISGLALRHPGATVLVPTEKGLVSANTGELSIRPIDGIDPSAEWVSVTGRTAVLSTFPTSWVDSVAVAQLAVASELVGLSQTILQMATEHVSTRTQFGRAIGSFQSVRHRLAESFTAIAAAKGAIEAAWEWPTPWASATAKAISGTAHAETARHAMQVCGGMGLSWEYDLHRYVRRGYALNALLGSTSVIARMQGLAITAGTLPPMVGSVLAPTATHQV
jgi:hypothetical protein